VEALASVRRLIGFVVEKNWFVKNYVFCVFSSRGVTWPLLAAVVSGCAVGVMYLFSSTNSALQEWSAQLLSTPVVYGCMIPLLDFLYGLLAVRCNSWENYAYDSVYYRHLILKVFPFRFVNRCVCC
jgi:hypothetical protein